MLPIIISNKETTEPRVPCNVEVSLQTFYDRHNDLDYLYEISNRWPRIYSVCRSRNPVILSSIVTYHLIFNMSDMTAVTSGAGTTYPSRVPGFSPGLSEFRGFQFEDMFALFHLANVLLLYSSTIFIWIFFRCKIHKRNRPEDVKYGILCFCRNRISAQNLELKSDWDMDFIFKFHIESSNRFDLALVVFKRERKKSIFWEPERTNTFLLSSLYLYVFSPPFYSLNKFLVEDYM